MDIHGNKFTKLFVGATFLLGVLLSGCGGGGGGGGNGNPPNKPSGISGVGISGTASKGIVKDGVVVAEELDNTATVITNVGNATTAADGSYSLTLNDSYTGGPIQITISANADTQMKCDVPAGCGTRTDGLVDTNTDIDFGEWYKPVSLTMTALVAGAQANAKIAVSVTPFTQMAAKLAKSAASFGSTAVANANSKVSKLLGGIDILKISPIDITDATAVANATLKTRITYAALTSAIANQGMTDANGQPDMNAAISLLAASFTGGKILADDSAGDDAAQISLQEIVDAANKTFGVIGIGDVTGILTGLQSDINLASTGDGTIVPPPSGTAVDSNLEKVKAMVSDVRTWGNVIRAEAESKANAFETQINLASNAGSVVLDDKRGKTLDAAIRAATRYNGGNVLSAYDLGTAKRFSSGTITSTTPGEITITDGKIYGHTVNMAVKFPADGTRASTFELNIYSATVNHDNADLIINSGMVKVNFASEYTIDYTKIEQGTALPVPDITSGAFDLNVQFTRKVDDNTGVALDSPVTFAGTLTFDVVAIPVTNNPTENKVLPTKFALTGSVSNTIGDSADISLVANIRNTKSFKFVGDFAPVGTPYSDNHPSRMVVWTYTDTNLDLVNDTFDLSYPGYSVNLFWSAVDGSVTDTECWSDYGCSSWSDGIVYDSLDSFLTTNPWMLPTSDIYTTIDGEGQYIADVTSANFTVDGKLDGVLIDPDFVVENASNWVDADIGLTFTVQLSGLPKARVNVTGDRTGFEAGDVTTTISYGTRQISIAASLDKTKTPPATGTVMITNQDGVVMTIDVAKETDSQTTGTLKYNATKYADIEETGRGYIKVSYIDGTFEIF